MAKIYLLIDPRTAEVRYVGWCKTTVANRLWRHLHEAKAGAETYKCRWLRVLIRIGAKPVAIVLEETERPQERECFWIAHYRQAGISMTNATDGGDGQCAPRSEETRSKMRASWTPERREAARVRRLGWKHSAETLAKMSAAWDNRPASKPLSPEHRAKIAAANVGRKHSSQTCAKLSLVLKGRKKRPLTDSERERRRRQSTGRRHSEATKEKLRAAKLGRKRPAFSEEWKRRIAAGMRRACAEGRRA